MKDQMHFVKRIKSLFSMKAQAIQLKDGDNIEITYLPSCRNAPGTPNPYIGMSGIVEGFDGTSFELFTGTSILIVTDIKTCKYKMVQH